jgi:hypothetical protein
MVVRPFGLFQDNRQRQIAGVKLADIIQVLMGTSETSRRDLEDQSREVDEATLVAADHDAFTFRVHPHLEKRGDRAGGLAGGIVHPPEDLECVQT